MSDWRLPSALRALHALRALRALHIPAFTPWQVDFDTLEDDTVTLRDRDSTEQRRMTVPELLLYLEEQIDG